MFRLAIREIFFHGSGSWVDQRKRLTREVVDLPFLEVFKRCGTKGYGLVLGLGR